MIIIETSHRVILNNIEYIRVLETSGCVTWYKATPSERYDVYISNKTMEDNLETEFKRM